MINVWAPVEIGHGMAICAIFRITRLNMVRILCGIILILVAIETFGAQRIKPDIRRVGCDFYFPAVQPLG